MQPFPWKGELTKLVRAVGSVKENWKGSVDQQNIANTAIADRIKSLVEHFRAYEEQQNTDDRKERTLNQITIFLVFLTVLFTGGSWWEFRGQLDEMRKASAQTDKIIGTNTGLAEAAKQQAEAADKQANAAIAAAQASRDAMIAAERAWAGAAGAKLSGGVTAGNEVKIVISTRNTGREPAMNFTWDMHPIVTAEDDVAFEAQVAVYVQSCLAANSKMGSQVLYPSSGFGTGFDFTSTFSKDQIDDDVVAGRKIIVVLGCLVYDSFERTRHSSFCYFSKGGSTPPDNLNICAGGSYAD